MTLERYLKDLVALLETLVGGSAAYYVLQELKGMGLKPPFVDLTISQKDVLLNRIAENVLFQVCSARKIAMFKSHMYYLMHMSAESASLVNRTEGSKWSG